MASSAQPGVVEGLTPGEQRAQHVDQHDLARVVPEVLLIEPVDRLALVDLEPLRHQRAEAVRREGLDTVGEIERREPQIRHLPERAAAQEAAGLQEAQAASIARLREKARNRDRAPAWRSPRSPVHRRMRGDEGEELAREPGARAPLRISCSVARDHSA